jgi:hypothetical protein
MVAEARNGKLVAVMSPEQSEAGRGGARMRGGGRTSRVLWWFNIASTTRLRRVVTTRHQHPARSRLEIETRVQPLNFQND